MVRANVPAGTMQIPDCKRWGMWKKLRSSPVLETFRGDNGPQLCDMSPFHLARL